MLFGKYTCGFTAQDTLQMGCYCGRGIFSLFWAVEKAKFEAEKPTFWENFVS